MAILDLLSQQIALTALSMAGAIKALLIPAAVFVLLAIIVKRKEAAVALRAAREEASTNLSIYLLDASVLLPLNAMALTGINAVLQHLPAHLFPEALWDALPQTVVLVAVIFFGDMSGYFRHRIEHTPLLWPAHAVHHSDTQMTFLTLERFHPINSWTTIAIDGLFLSFLGFPAWAIVANQLFRHYYGYFIHADLPWTFGPLSAVFVSPVMHRWHHANDEAAVGKNFATVFSVFDRVFGTYHVPGLCSVPLGVPDDIGSGPLNQLVYPFRAWAKMLFKHDDIAPAHPQVDAQLQTQTESVQPERL